MIARLSVAMSVAVAAVSLATAAMASRGDDPSMRFRDITSQSGIRFAHARARFDPRLEKVMTWVTSINAGACAADYDGDGDVDYFLLTSMQGKHNALVQNDGAGAFTDVTAASGLAGVNSDESISMACLFADLDNDGDQDLFVAAYGRNRVFLNDGGGGFSEPPGPPRFAEPGNSSSAIAFDYDGDGWLDLMVGRYFPEDLRRLTTTAIFPTTWESARNGGRNLLYRNNRDGTFTESAHALGVDDPGWTLALGAGDLDDDGDADVYVANDFGPDVVYRNDGHGRFTDVTADAIGNDGDAGMNADFGDFDNDGRLDVYVTNITNAVFDQGNMLWKNLGSLRFANVAREMNVRDGGWGWGAKFVDLDNDGDLDLYTANGFVSDGPVDLFRMPSDVYRGNVSDLRAWPDMRGFSLSGHERKRLFRNDGNGFLEMAGDAGLDAESDARGVLAADIDGDGDMDLLVTNVAAQPTLYRNELGQRRSWIEAELIGTGANRDAIGARVTITSGPRRQIREVDGGNGYCGQSSRLVHVGLDAAQTVDALEVRWPDARRVRYRDLPAGIKYVVSEEGPSR